MATQLTWVETPTGTNCFHSTSCSGLPPSSLDFQPPESLLLLLLLPLERGTALHDGSPLNYANKLRSNCLVHCLSSSLPPSPVFHRFSAVLNGEPGSGSATDLLTATLSPLWMAPVSTVSSRAIAYLAHVQRITRNDGFIRSANFRRRCEWTADFYASSYFATSCELRKKGGRGSLNETENWRGHSSNWSRKLTK